MATSLRQEVPVKAKNLTEKALKAAIQAVVGRSRSNYADLTRDELSQTCENLGLKMSPYLVIEAHLTSCGGHATQGKGSFDLDKLLTWLKRRADQTSPVRPRHGQAGHNKPMDLMLGSPVPIRGRHQRYSSVRNQNYTIGKDGLPQVGKLKQNNRIPMLNQSIDAGSSSRNMASLIGFRDDVARASVTTLPTDTKNTISPNMDSAVAQSQQFNLPLVASSQYAGDSTQDGMMVGRKMLRVQENNVQFGDYIQAFRDSKQRGTSLRTTFVGNKVTQNDIRRMVRDDVTANYRPPSDDWKEETQVQKKLNFEKKVQDTFEIMKKSSKVNKLLLDSFSTISHDYEVSSASAGAWQQDKSKERLRSDLYKMSHQKKGHLKNFYMREAQATDAARLEGLLESKWYDNRHNYKMLSKISPKGSDRLNRILDDRKSGGP